MEEQNDLKERTTQIEDDASVTLGNAESQQTDSKGVFSNPLIKFGVLFLAVLVLGLIVWFLLKDETPTENASTNNNQATTEISSNIENNEETATVVSTYDDFCSDTAIEHFRWEPNDGINDDIDSSVFSLDKSKYAFATVDAESPHFGLQDLVIGESADKSEETLLSRTQDQYDDGLTPIMFSTSGDMLYVASKTQSSHGGGINKAYVVNLSSKQVSRIEPDDATEGHMTAFTKSCKSSDEMIAYAQSARGGYGQFGPPTQIFYGDEKGVASIYVNNDEDVNSISSIMFTEDRKYLVFTIDELIRSSTNDFPYFTAQRESLWLLNLDNNETQKVFEADLKYPIVNISVSSESTEKSLVFTTDQYAEAEFFGEGVGAKGDPISATYSYDLASQKLTAN